MARHMARHVQAKIASNSRAIWREIQNFKISKILKKIKKFFQQVRYMKICSVGILDNDVLHL